MKKLFYTFSMAVLVIVASCKNKEDSIVGPEYTSVTSEFRLEAPFSAALDNVNFLNGNQQFFKADFNQKVSWKLTLRGKESGAVKYINGTSQNLDISNSIWLGENDSLFFFRDGEEVNASLTLLGKSEPYKTSFALSKSKTYPNVVALGNGFEGTFRPKTATWGYSPFGDDPGGVLEFANFDNSTCVQGNNSFRLAGTDKNNDFYVGSLRTPVTKGSINKPASDVYFNIYVFGNGDANSTLTIAAKQAIGRQYNDANDDSFEYQIKLNHKGWKLVSINYNDFIRSTSKNFGGNGPNIKNPALIVAFDYSLMSNPAGQKAEAIFDFPTITYGAPFKP